MPEQITESAKFSTFFERLNWWANETGDAPALYSADAVHPMTYADLASQILQTGLMTTRMGLGRGDRVAMLVEHGPLAASSFLALNVGVSVAPLNPAMKADEIRQTLLDLGVRALVVSNATPNKGAQVAADMGIPVLTLHAKSTNTCAFELRGPQVEKTGSVSNTAKDIALLLRTSGTTGRPKLVPLSHTNIYSSACNIANSLQLTPLDRGVVIMPMFHIHGLIAALLAPLVCGGSVMIAQRFDAEKFLGLAAGFGATWYTGVPTMHQAILRACDAKPLIAARCRFRFIRSSSSALPASVRAELEAKFSAPVIEAYGMTEAAHQIASQRFNTKSAPGSVGSPNGLQVSILNSSGETLGAGASGEVAIRGPNVMSGYDNNPDVNAETFVNGWMRTGDIGRFDAAGSLFLVGRIKEIVNRGGFQISPVEVEGVLLAQPGVSQAVAFAIPHQTLEQDLVCAVVLEPGAKADEVVLRKAMFKFLSDYKVPSSILIVDDIPLGPTGKIQRIGLDKAFADLLTLAHVEPDGPLEAMLVDMVEEVLPGRRLGVLDNFFLSGGDSLSGARLISRLRGIFGLELAPEVLFLYPSIKCLCRHLEIIEGGLVRKLIEKTLVEIDTEIL